jgi:hypothetical protein
LTTPDPVCPNCGAVVASDQEYCLDCGERVVSEGPLWRTPLIAVATVLVVAIAILAFGYRGLVHDADREAAAPSPTSTTAIRAGRAGRATTTRTATTRAPAPRSR